MNENERGGNEEVELNGSEDPTSSLLEDAPTEANGNATTHHSVTNPRPTTMSKVASLLHVFLVLVLRVVFRFWKVCIAELLLVILVFWLYGGVFVFFLMVAALVSKYSPQVDFFFF